MSQLWISTLQARLAKYPSGPPMTGWLTVLLMPLLLQNPRVNKIRLWPLVMSYYLPPINGFKPLNYYYLNMVLNLAELPSLCVTEPTRSFIV